MLPALQSLALGHVASPGLDEPIGAQFGIGANLGLELHRADRLRGAAVCGLGGQCWIAGEGFAEIGGGPRSLGVKRFAGAGERRFLIFERLQVARSHAARILQRTGMVTHGTVEPTRDIAGLPIGRIDSGVEPNAVEHTASRRRFVSDMGGIDEPVPGQCVENGGTRIYAHIEGWCPHEAALRSVTKGLPRQPAEDGHFAAMPNADVPALVVQLNALAETAGRDALLFTLLNATRSGETRLAPWPEFDLKSAVWTIPAARMKMKKEHIVPLSPQAVVILKRRWLLRSDDEGLVFTNDGTRPLSDMTWTAGDDWSGCMIS